MNNTMSKSSKTGNKTLKPDGEETNAARHAVMVIARAIKNRSIYPREHSGITQMMQAAVEGLAAFNEKFGPLRLTITKYALLYNQEPVLESEQTNDPIIYPMYRDGLVWIEFLPGMETEEFEEFVDLLVEHRKLDPEAESDLAASLWERDFAHLLHEAVDPELESSPPIDLATFRVMTESSYEERSQLISCPPPESPPDRPQPALLSEEDRTNLRRMIEKEEEELSKPEDVLDVLLVLLVNQTSEKDFETVLQSLAETFSESLGQGRFNACMRCLRSIQSLARKTEKTSKWRWKLLNSFGKQVCTCTGWQELSVNLKKDEFTSSQIEALVSVLKALPEQILEPAALLLASAKNETLRKALVATIAIHAKANPELITELLKNIESRVILEVLEVFEHITKELASPILMELARHQDPGVRAKAVWMLSRYDMSAAVTLFELINDPEPSVRQQIILQLGQTRNPAAENLLLKYLQNRNAIIDDKIHVMACYQALGRCGSDRCLAFLEKMLFSSPLKDAFNRKRAIHRKGAAVALALLGTATSEKLLRKGSSSMSPYVRKACRAAIEQARITPGAKGKSYE